MHIPDGYMSLQTTIPAIGVMVPFWAKALDKVKKGMSARQVPVLALCAAFSFVVMMFNIPVWQSSAHAVGAVFIAILLGPWAACIAVSVALLIQAVVFGDGGILAYGANCFNMALVMPFSGYLAYKAIRGKSDILSKRSLFGIFAGGYVGLNLAALCAAVEFGIQPLLFKAADGTPLFGYYPLSVSVPAMLFPHLLIAGPAEGIITAGAVIYLARLAPHLLEGAACNEGGTVFRRYKPFIAGLAVLIALTPLGLIASETAWGEWSAEELKEKIGFLPQGFARFSDFWKAALPDYTVPGLDGGFFKSSSGYIISAVLGMALIFTVILITSRLVLKGEKGNERVER